ncbi:unnamed protein product [Moneuplotes crassus]|uniref:LITAF domain-containing protein n=1 Tax=Euplotes crassus TaxID=5936 RepID=A0AAD2D0X7_EUPCR|nr:unnamed protein product [Moneuplotes crassus]
MADYSPVALSDLELQSSGPERERAKHDSMFVQVVVEKEPFLAYCYHCRKTTLTKVKTECNCEAVPICLCFTIFFIFCYICCIYQYNMTRPIHHHCGNCNNKLFKVANNLISCFSLLKDLEDGDTAEKTHENMREALKNEEEVTKIKAKIEKEKQELNKIKELNKPKDLDLKDPPVVPDSKEINNDDLPIETHLPNETNNDSIPPPKPSKPPT